jgi:hypothetical protein
MGRPARATAGGSRELKGRVPPRTPTSDAHLGRPPRTPTSDAHLGRPPRTPTSDAHLGRQPRTPASDASLGRQPRTPASAGRRGPGRAVQPVGEGSPFPRRPWPAGQGRRRPMSRPGRATTLSRSPDLIVRWCGPRSTCPPASPHLGAGPSPPAPRRVPVASADTRLAAAPPREPCVRMVFPCAGDERRVSVTPASTAPTSRSPRSTIADRTRPSPADHTFSGRDGLSALFRC